MPTLTKLYSIEEVAKHNTRDDCWLVIDGKVYDVTKYLDDHPGGDDVLLQATGKDATEEFEDAGHSKSAREEMQQYRVGELHISPIIPELDIIDMEASPGFTGNLMSKKTMQYWTIPVAVIGISVLAGLLYMRKRS